MMYGPDVDSGAVVMLVAVVLMFGGLLGVGCYEGCGYVVRHVDVEWKP